MKITIILGSIREGRKSNRVATYLQSLLNEREGVEAFLLDLKEYPLPQYAYKWKDQAQPAENLPVVGRILSESDAMIFISPEYHGSYTGVLKNAVDHYWKEFKRKAIGVVATGSGKMGGINASTEMQQLVLSLGAYPLPTKLLVPHIQNNFLPSNKPAENWLVEDCKKFLDEFIWLSQAIHRAKMADLLPSKS